MSEHAATPHSDTHSGDTHGHEDPMSHVPPGSIWPLLLTIALTLLPFGTLAALGKLKFGGDFIGLFTLPFSWQVGTHTGVLLLVLAIVGLMFTLMGWAHQIIREKRISHDLMAQQSDLKFFTVCFLGGELVVFGAIFAYFYHQKIWDVHHEFTVPHTLHFGGPIVAYATFVLISSSVTCEIAHHCLEHGKRGMAKIFLLGTIVLGVIFLGLQGKEYGELIARGFTPSALSAAGYEGHASFASIFYTSTGFHGLHVGIGLIMLFMVLLRLEAGHFKGKRQFSAVAASWYWHFVDIVWVFLFITVYVAG